MENTRKIKLEKWLHTLILVFVIIQPIIDMDYLFYDFVNSLGLPRFATVVRFVILPLLVVCSFILREPKKKRTFSIAFVYGVLFFGYFFLHTKQAQALFPRLDLTDNFKFNTFQELTYVLTLVLPYGITYFIYHEHFDLKEIKSMTMITSFIVSVPIVVGDLFVFARSTYYGYTVGNFFTWFTPIYDWYHPRTLASKFFFNEGNTIGILLFMVLPLLYYFFIQEEDQKKRKQIGILIVLQSLAMQMLATRVATYGVILIPFVYIVLHIFDSKALKRSKLQKNTLIYFTCVAIVFGLILDRTPAVQNQKVDAINDTALLHNGMADAGKLELANAEDLIPGTPEYINFYVYMFETYGINARYIQSVPSMYYTEYYNYQHDPKFWCDVTFMPVFDRVSGRQIETIFFNYKYKELTSKEKLLGMGYSSFMNGSIVLEQDFKQQIYTLGYIGELLCIFPWIGIMLYGLVMFIKKYKDLINLETITYVIALGAGFGSAWLSGHVLDQFMTTTFIALLVAILLNRVNESKVM